jgi:hypothetical protein
LIHQAMYELGIPLIHRGRDNSGGSIFTEKDPSRTFVPPFCPERFARTLCKHAGVCVEAQADDAYPRTPEAAQYLIESFVPPVSFSDEEPRPEQFGLTCGGQLRNRASHSAIPARIVQRHGE